jgi:hypothetical protein
VKVYDPRKSYTKQFNKSIDSNANDA